MENAFKNPILVLRSFTPSVRHSPSVRVFWLSKSEGKKYREQGVGVLPSFRTGTHEVPYQEIDTFSSTLSQFRKHLPTAGRRARTDGLRRSKWKETSSLVRLRRQFEWLLPSTAKEQLYREQGVCVLPSFSIKNYNRYRSYNFTCLTGRRLELTVLKIISRTEAGVSSKTAKLKIWNSATFIFYNARMVATTQV